MPYYLVSSCIAGYYLLVCVPLSLCTFYVYYFNFYVGVMKLFVRVWYYGVLFLYIFYRLYQGPDRHHNANVLIEHRKAPTVEVHVFVLSTKTCTHFNCGCLSFTSNMAGKATATKHSTPDVALSTAKNYACKHLGMTHEHIYIYIALVYFIF